MNDATNLSEPDVVEAYSETSVRTPEPVVGLRRDLSDLRDEMLAFEAVWSDRLAELHPHQRASARNLLHYISLRHHDIRPLQEQLVTLGLSSLGRCEAHVLSNLNAVLTVLDRMDGTGRANSSTQNAMTLAEGQERIKRNTKSLFGHHPRGRGAHIMVTMPSEAADDYLLVRDVLSAGMNCMRVNCSHDDEAAWGAMIGNLRRAEEELKKPCKVFMDLGGPKLRTGPVASGEQVMKVRPLRDEYGRTVLPAVAWLSGHDGDTEPPRPTAYHVRVDDRFLARLEPGTVIRFEDARGRTREFTVIERSQRGAWVEASKTAYLRPRIKLRAATPSGRKASGRVGDVPAQEQPLVLNQGDRLIVTDDHQPGEPARYDKNGRVVRPARISCTLSDVLRDLRVGERMLFDDGKIAGVIKEKSDHYAIVEITGARRKGERLRGDKGINLPDSRLRLDALTDVDLQHLEFVVQNADMVGYSFVRRTRDIYRLQDELRRLGRPDMPIVLKIENAQAFQNIPFLLLAAMRSPVAGAMIARGDLAVECGYERLAEIQEEILWMCEAAHLPVVWATQVLEGLAKNGVPSRAEITDAAMSVRAECVMLNKGPFVVDAVRALDNILLRMQDHQVKKRPMLRRLDLAEHLYADEEVAAERKSAR